MKTTKKDFDTFKKEFVRWQHLFGLSQYRVVFHHAVLEGRHAEITVNECGKIAVVSLSRDTCDDAVFVPAKTNARHEAIHLLLSRLSWLAGCRYLAESDLDEEEEGIVRRVESVLDQIG